MIDTCTEEGCVDIAKDGMKRERWREVEREWEMGEGNARASEKIKRQTLGEENLEMVLKCDRVTKGIDCVFLLSGFLLGEGVVYP